MNSNLLKVERIKHGWTQAKVAEAVGVDAKTVGRWERGKALPYPYYREQLCLLFGKTAQQLGLPSADVLPSADEKDFLQDATSLDIQSPGPDTAVQVSFLADPTIPLYLESPASLVGRHSVLMEVKERLLTGDTVVVTAVDGLPGVGKTALAIVLTMDQQVRDHFCDGILWAGLGSHSNVLGHLARWGMLLGVIPDQVKNIKSREAWLQALQAAIGTRRMLLIIDDAWTAEDALSLQVGGMRCAHVVTTRLPEVALAFDQEGGITIGPLEEMERIDLLSLFVPDLVQQDPQGARMLVKAVGGLPLALTLMGSYLISQSFPAQSHCLQIALALLHGTKETLRMRMPRVLEEGFASLGETMPLSLYAVIAMCDQRLSPQAHTALHALTTFLPKPESFSLEAALAVTQQSVETLDALCDAGLLEAWGLGRYLLHQAVTDYVRVQGKVAAIQGQQEYVADSWLTNPFAEQERNDPPTTGSASLRHERLESGRDKKYEMILSLHRDRPVGRRTQHNRSKILGLVLLCFVIVASGTYAAFFLIPTVIPTPTPAPTPTSMRLQITAIDDSVQGTGTNQFNYVGSGWHHNSNNCQGNPCEYNNDNSWDHITNNYVTVSFTGVQIKFYGVLSPKHGIGAVSIDGGSETMIDFYTANRAGDQLMWTSPTLPAGTHIFKLRVTGNKNPSNTDFDADVAVDRVDILS